MHWCDDTALSNVYSISAKVGQWSSHLDRRYTDALEGCKGHTSTGEDDDSRHAEGCNVRRAMRNIHHGRESTANLPSQCTTQHRD